MTLSRRRFIELVVSIERREPCYRFFSNCG